ncbi:MAG: nicotinate (nicotinamide) nucleotide adenylyltransferase [Treponema sp.]|nr:nicotinate (nicotinamide) nucleotide adenylyltransferase [Treponema sp.]
MKLGILGGSFNPVHNGHLFLAEKVLSVLNLDRIVFIPAFISPFKQDSGEMEINTQDRLEMLAAAISGDSRFAIDNCEIRREGVSYTVDTLRDIIARFLPSGKPVLIIGDDLTADFSRWKESETILQLADIAVARRVNSGKANYPFPHIVIENEVMNISSSDIRKKIREQDLNNGWRCLLPLKVRSIIEDRRLYGFKTAKPVYSAVKLADIIKIEETARETLTLDRFLHSRNTAVHASDLCRRFGIDPMAGYLAGIAHDLAKQTDNKLLLKICKSEGLRISHLEKKKPNLLHGKAAAVLLRDRFCIHNKDILDAVAFHTSGCENMEPLAKIIYIADKTESSRNIDPALRKMCATPQAAPLADLDDILLAVLERTIIKLKAKELNLSDDTLRLLNRVKGKV